MDNLFAVIAPIKHQNDVIFSDKSFNDLFKNYSHQVINIPSKKHIIYFVRYTNTVIQPKKFTSSFNPPVISNARIDNKQQLIPLLDNKLFKNKNINENLTTEEFIFSAYKKWGNTCFEKIKGNFSTILWDEQNQQLHAAIDAFSSRSLFYSQINEVLYLSSGSKLLSTYIEQAFTINRTAISQWLAGRPDPNSAMFNEVSLLPAGTSLQFSCTKGVTIKKHWDINPNLSIKYKNLKEYKSHFFDLLSNSVNNRLIHDDNVSTAGIYCQMSGGMDSTSVTALAKQAMDKNNQPLYTLSHRYTNTESCDESDNITDMVSTLKLQHQHFIELDKFDNITFAQLYPTDFDSPGIVLSPKYHQELQLMSSLGANILLTGNGGDETCWGHSASYRARLFKGELGVISEVINACDELGEPVVRSLYKLFVPNMLQNLLKMLRNKPKLGQEQPKWLSKEASELVTYANNNFSNPFSAGFNPAKHARYHGLKTTSTYNAMRSYQQVASLYGIDVRHPFFDTDVVEFSFAIPEKMLIQGIYPKWLLRQTMQHYLPESVCWKKTKVVFDHHFANLVQNNKTELRLLLSHTGLQDLGLINNAILLKEFDDIVNNSNSYLHVDMLYAILTQLWFQTHCL